MSSLKSPHQGDSNENTKSLKYPKSAAMFSFQGTKERVRNSRGKRAISVRATEVLLYNQKIRVYDTCLLLQLNVTFITFLYVLYKYLVEFRGMQINAEPAKKTSGREMT